MMIYVKKKKIASFIYSFFHIVLSGNDTQAVFNSGAWVEPLGVLVIINDMSTLYFIRANGMEITRRTRVQLKLSSPIIDLFVQEDLNSKNTSL